MIAESIILKDDEVARRGHEVFNRVVLPRLRPEDHGKFVMLDIVSEDFEIDDDDFTASQRLRTRQPSGRFWLMQAGYPTAYRFAGAR